MGVHDRYGRTARCVLPSRREGPYRHAYYRSRRCGFPQINPERALVRGAHPIRRLPQTAPGLQPARRQIQGECPALQPTLR